MYYINFILISIFVCIWLRNAYLANKYFWDKAWELERIRPRLIWGKNIDAPKWIKNKELRRIYTSLKLRSFIFTLTTIWILALVGAFIEALYLGKEWPDFFMEAKFWFLNIAVFIVTLWIRYK